MKIDPKKINALHTRKANESFNTKFNIYLFYELLENNLIVESNSILEFTSFIKFTLNDEKANFYAFNYWQRLENNEIVYNEKSEKVKDLYNEILKFKKEHHNEINALKDQYIDNFKNVIFKLEDFQETCEGVSCHYCGINQEKLKLLFEREAVFKKNLRGWTLEIDRKSPNLEYTKDNCVLACYWCNNAKTDEFNEEEFAIIANGIRKVWDERLKK